MSRLIYAPQTLRTTSVPVPRKLDNDRAFERKDDKKFP